MLRGPRCLTADLYAKPKTTEPPIEIALPNGVVTPPSHNHHHLITGNRGERAAVRGSRRELSDGKLRQSEVTEDGPRSARNESTVMKGVCTHVLGGGADVSHGLRRT